MPARSERNWSRRVTRTSNALDLEAGVFTWADPKHIAASLSRSAMSMLVFYINRAGRKLDRRQRQVLEQAKQELRQLYHKA